MAKISANGGKEVSRFVSCTGTTYLLRSDGRVLRKYNGENKWLAVVGKKLSLEEFDALRVRIGKPKESR